MSLLISLLGSRPSTNVEIFDTVNTFADLPSNATLNRVYQVLTSTGLLINRKVRGLYYYDGAQWQLITGLEANSVLYNNTDSNLSATNVKAGLDELDGAKEPNIPAGTASQYITGIKTLEELNKDSVKLDQVQNVDQTNATNITSGTLDAARLPNNIDAIKIANGTVSNGKFQFINSLTSNAQDQLNNKEPIITAGTTGQYLAWNKTFQNVGKEDVGLSEVDNTSDLNKPISTATQNALDNKYDSSNPNNYETPAELNARDTANRQRSNHTGTQTASTILDFNTAVANSPPVSLNTSKISADGSVTTHSDITSAGSGQIITVAERNNLNNQSGTNTGDETTLSIQTKRPLKTIQGQSIEGSGNINLASGSSAPVGSTLFYMGATVPNDYLLMNGASLSTTTYNLLFNVIGYNFGGSGGNFNLPNALYYGNSAGVYLRACLSGEVGNLQDMDIQSHTHSITRRWSFNSGGTSVIKQGSTQNSFYQTIQTGATGGAETRPKTMRALLIIKYQ
jgi:microcystin-dependent protein